MASVRAEATAGGAGVFVTALLRQVEREIIATPEGANYSRRLGTQLGGRLTEVDDGNYFIRLKGGSRRNIDAVMADLRQRVEARAPGITV